MPEYTVEVKQADYQSDGIVATYLRNGEKIALSFGHRDLMDEITAWVMKHKVPANATFYKF